MANTSSPSDSLTVYLSGDAWNGDAQALLSVNGVQVGGVLDVAAANAADNAQAFTFTGNFGAAPTVSLSFINDAYGGSASMDRNLDLDGFSYDGVAQLGIKQSLGWDQTDTYTLASAPAPAERASAFLNAMGVNVHLAYTDTSYGNTAELGSALGYLGVTRLRVGIDDISRNLPQLQAFAAQGFKFDVLMDSANTDAGLLANVASVNQIAGAVTSIEGPNETNITSNFSWDGQNTYAAAAAYQKALYTDVKADPSLAAASVYSLTLAGVGAPGYTALGDIAPYATDGNMHVYYYNGTAPYATIQYVAGLNAISEPGIPLVITETNYTNDPAIYGSVSSGVQAKYDLDIFMDAAKAGVQSTYVYELLDEFADPNNTNNEEHYGLFNADGTPKPAATAIHNLRAVLADPGATAATFAPGTLGCTLTGLPASGDTLMMEKSNGRYDLAVWAEPQIWNAATSSEVAATPRQVTVALGQLASTVSVFDPLAGTAAIAQYSNTSQVSVSVTDHPLIIEIDTAPPVATSMASSTAAGGTLATGQTDVLTLATSEGVSVSGAPALLLSDGGRASYDAARSTATALAFDYTALATQASASLAVTGADMAGGTITDAAGKALAMPAATPGTALGVSVNPALLAAPQAVTLGSGAAGVDAAGTTASAPSGPMMAAPANSATPTPASPAVIASAAPAAATPGSALGVSVSPALLAAPQAVTLGSGAAGADAAGTTASAPSVPVMAAPANSVTSTPASPAVAAPAAPAAATAAVPITAQSANPATPAAPVVSTQTGSATLTTPDVLTPATLGTRDSNSPAVPDNPNAGVFGAAHSQYAYGAVDGNMSLLRLQGGTDGTSTLAKGQVVQFADGTGIADPDGTVSDIARLYQAAFNRTPDLPGLTYWAGVEAQGVGLGAVAQAFTGTQEFLTQYSGVSDDGFVVKLYQNVLGRLPDPAGEASWDNNLAQGLTRADTLIQFAGSSENKAGTLSMSGSADMGAIARLYQAAFDHPADQPGLNFWTQKLHNPGGLEGVAQQFTESPEFLAAYGNGSNDAFVVKLYENTLARAPDASGEASWNNAMAGGASRSQALIGFAQSNESRMNTSSVTHDGLIFLGK